ncbi:hypothetical protein SAY86_022940 [Trapa natans]|uniref:CRC domain-containing protein n=1 Tax=Trapa natans TaxID=22666 RepID=A0AAN7M9W9_TRANT|nr:hypothetical protein SAY86_022940 [Trapa natans]
MHCQNNIENQAVRQEAIEATLGRNPNAFKPKIDNSPLRLRDHGDQVEAVQVVGKHNKGCQCKKTGCLKKYCECFQAGIPCSDNCRCKDCRNYEGSEERSSLYHVGLNTMTHAQQAANAAICGTIGSSCYGAPALRRVGIFASMNGKFTQGSAYLQQENNHNASVVSLPVSAADTANILATQCPNYRSPLANILQLQDVKRLCSLLVVVSTEATKKTADIFSGIEDEISKPAEMNSLRAPIATSTQKQDCNERDICLSEEIAQDHFCMSQAQRYETSSSVSILDDKQYERPTSPATLALLCDERDSLFVEEGLQKGMACQPLSTSNGVYRYGSIEVYAEQEKLVLTNFHDFLSNLVILRTEDMSLGTTLTIEAGDEGKQPKIEIRDGNKRRDQPERPYPNGMVNLPAAETKEPLPLAVMGDTALGTSLMFETEDEAKQPNFEMKDGNERRDRSVDVVVSFPAAATKESSFLAVIGGMPSTPDRHLKIGLSNGSMESEIESMV